MKGGYNQPGVTVKLILQIKEWRQFQQKINIVQIEKK